MDHLDISEVIGDGINPDEPRVVAHWAASKTETPIRIATGPYRGALKPNTDTVMPACVAQVLVDSGYEVEVKYNAIVNPEVDGFVDEALEAREGPMQGEPPAGTPLTADELAANAGVPEQTPAPEPDQAPSFNPELWIAGTVADVKARLDGLTLEQLEAIKAAEIDREQPRKGVAEAIEDAIAKLGS